MGFPNVDIFLVGKLLEKFTAVKASPTFAVADLFEDLTSQDWTDITIYLGRKTFTKDLRDRPTSAVYIMPHFPLLDMPLPQIGISLGNEQTVEKFLDDTVGDATPYPSTGTQTHWDVPKGYWASANYTIDVAAATKDETIWLARFVQRFLCEEQDALDAIGAKEVTISQQDMRLNNDQMPVTVFNRQVTVSCKVANTWTKRLPVSTYTLGANSGAL